jgi:peptide/nickel transport system substrate-binding protein
MAASYWEHIHAVRTTRRRAIALAGGTAVGAALLAACGSDRSADTSDKSSIVTKHEDVTRQAKRGGILKDRAGADIATMDPHGPIAPLNIIARHVYSTLVRQKAGHLAPSTTDLVGDLAESWETSGDGLTITMKLRNNVKWHNKSPVNGRAFDSSDVIYSWNRYAATAPLRGLVANSANPTAPIVSITAPDARSVVVKLNEPLAYALATLASFGSFTGNVVIVPKEVESGLDIRREMVGTGPFYLDSYQPSVGFTLKRHADYWDQQANFVDQVNYPIVIDNAQVEAQLKAGNIHVFAPRAENMLQLKKDEPRFNVYPIDLTVAVTVMTFGHLPEKNPLTDERVRQAFSMSMDRKAWIDAFFNVSNFEQGGLPVTSRWNSSLPLDFVDYWLDPQGKDFGPNAKYFQHNLEEAKKLLSAAGHPGGLTVKSNRITTNAIGDLYRHAEVMEAMALDGGFKIQVNAVDYATDYIPRIRDANGQYEGIGFHSVTGTTPWRLHPISALAAEYWSKAGVTFKGFSVNGRNDKSGDPAVDALIEKARLEKDVNRQKAYAQDLQRILAKAMYGMPSPGSATTFHLAWPAVRNYQTYRSAPSPAAGAHYAVWLDETKPPFTSA